MVFYTELGKMQTERLDIGGSETRLDRSKLCHDLKVMIKLH